VGATMAHESVLNISAVKGNNNRRCSGDDMI
jgi:hypothetical protein